MGNQKNATAQSPAEKKGERMKDRVDEYIRNFKASDAVKFAECVRNGDWKNVSRIVGNIYLAGVKDALDDMAHSINTHPPILDACCGGKMFYFDKNNPLVLFQDIREVETTLCDGRHFEVKPDVVADFTNMPYADNSFAMVVFDPPHLVHSRGKKSIMADLYGCLSEKTQVTGWQQIKYGALYSDWRDLLSKGFAECFRVLRPGGFLIFKWNETDIKVPEILKLTPHKPIFGHISGKRANTHWICFRKGGRL